MVRQKLFSSLFFYSLFVCILFLLTVVKSFNLKDVKGVPFTICDPLETSIDSDEILKHVLESRNYGDFYLKFSFNMQTARQNELVLSTVSKKSEY